MTGELLWYHERIWRGRSLDFSLYTENIQKYRNIFSRLGQYVKLGIMQQRETEKYLMGLVSRRTLLYLQYVYRSRIHEQTILLRFYGHNLELEVSA